MPKEITHWLLAMEALENLEHNSRLKAIITRNLDYYLLGAVIYDTPYSYPGFTLKQKEFRKIANQLHGVNGENLLQPFQNLISTVKDREKDLAFTLGILTHVITDSVFHPVVYYFTGNYYSEDRQKQNEAVSNHRWLETHLDLWFLDQLRDKVNLDKKYLKLIVGGLTELPILLNKFCRAIPVDNPQEKSKIYERALAYHALFQKLFSSRFSKSLLTLILGPKHKLVALFYPANSSFKGEMSFSYLHPMTGVKSETDFNQLREVACGKIEGFMEEMNIIISSRGDTGQNVDEFLLAKLRGPLQASMFGEKPSEMKFFNAFFDKGFWLGKK